MKIREACRPREVRLGIAQLDPLVVAEQATTTTSTTSVPPTTTTIVPACVATFEVDPDDTLGGTLVQGQLATIPVRFTVVSGHTFNLSLQVAPAEGQCLPPCGTNIGISGAGAGTHDNAFSYTPPVSATPTVNLTASIQPKGFPITCNQFSQGGTDTKTFTLTPP